MNLSYVVVTIFLGVTMASYWTGGRGYTAALFYIPAILGEVLVNTLPSHNKVGLLFGYWVSSMSFPFIILLHNLTVCA